MRNPRNPAYSGRYLQPEGFKNFKYRMAPQLDGFYEDIIPCIKTFNEQSSFEMSKQSLPSIHVSRLDLILIIISIFYSKI